jgi:ferredoxin
MEALSRRIKSLIREQGAPLVGIAAADALSQGPPSADPRYLLPEAQSVISFAIALDQSTVKSFIAKETWRPHCDDRKETVQRLYSIGDMVAETLKIEGFAAVNVDINNNYRPEEGAADITEMTEFHPQFSHRYAGLAAGIGRLGWSGNLMTREYGALVELGSVITAAELIPDDSIPDDEHPCDGCRVCTAVCPVGMIPTRDSITVEVAGIRETIARKEPNTCCWIGCTGYEGLSRDGRWSNWSPFRLGRPLPESKAAIDKLCISLQKADPQMQAEESSFADYRRAVFDPDWLYYTVCGFCRSVCARDRDERILNRKAIYASGTAALTLDGSHVVADERAVEMDTPFGLKIVIGSKPRSDLQDSPEGPNRESYPQKPLPLKPFPLEQEALEFIRRKLQTDRPKDEDPR